MYELLVISEPSLEDFFSLSSPSLSFSMLPMAASHIRRRSSILGPPSLFSTGSDRGQIEDDDTVTGEGAGTMTGDENTRPGSAEVTQSAEKRPASMPYMDSGVGREALQTHTQHHHDIDLTIADLDFYYGLGEIKCFAP